MSNMILFNVEQLEKKWGKNDDVDADLFPYFWDFFSDFGPSPIEIGGQKVWTKSQIDQYLFLAGEVGNWEIEMDESEYIVFPNGEYIFEPLPVEMQVVVDLVDKPNPIVPEIAIDALKYKALSLLNERRDYLLPNWREVSLKMLDSIGENNE